MREPTIDFEELADRAREAFGEQLARITQRDRVGRSEVIELHFADERSLRFENRYTRDPDAVRRHVLEVIEMAEARDRGPVTTAR